MNSPVQVGREARSRLLELFEQIRATELELIAEARREVERLNGPHCALSLAVLCDFKEDIERKEYAVDPLFITLCDVIEGRGVVPAQPRRLSWLQSLFARFR